MEALKKWQLTNMCAVLRTSQHLKYLKMSGNDSIIFSLNVFYVFFYLAEAELGDVSPANGGGYHQIANWCGGKKEEAQVRNQIPNIIYTNDCQYANYCSTFVKWSPLTFH